MHRGLALARELDASLEETDVVLGLVAYDGFRRRLSWRHRPDCELQMALSTALSCSLSACCWISCISGK